MIIANTTRVDYLLKDMEYNTHKSFNSNGTSHMDLVLFKTGYSYPFHSYAHTLSAFLQMLIAKKFPNQIYKWYLQFSACPYPLEMCTVAKSIHEMVCVGFDNRLSL